MAAEVSHYAIPEQPELAEISLHEYLSSIIFMPKSMRILCLTNLFCWMSLVCYSLYFTDFVGEAVFGGNPKVQSLLYQLRFPAIVVVNDSISCKPPPNQAPVGSVERETYEEGVRFACWGLAMYSLSCSCYSFIIERLVKRFR